MHNVKAVCIGPSENTICWTKERKRKHLKERKEEDKVPGLKANHLNCYGFDSRNSLNGLNGACCY